MSNLLLILLNIILISELRFLSINLICLCICLVTKQILISSYCVPGIRFDNVFFMNDINTFSYKVEGKKMIAVISKDIGDSEHIKDNFLLRRCL